jgi:hypothetical protein
MFWSKNIPSNSIYDYKESLLSIWTLSTKECSIEDENRWGILREIWMKTNIVLFFWMLLSFSGTLMWVFCVLFWSKLKNHPQVQKGFACGEGNCEEELYIFLRTSSTFILKYMATFLTAKALFLISFPVLNYWKWGTFWTLFIHKNKIERISLSIMPKT